jgi:hypothetical protein
MVWGSNRSGLYPVAEVLIVITQRTIEDAICLLSRKQRRTNPPIGNRGVKNGFEMLTDPMNRARPIKPLFRGVSERSYLSNSLKTISRDQETQHVMRIDT